MNKPNVGQIVTITTKFPNHCVYDENQFNEFTYENVEVLKSEKWFKPDQFKISSDCNHMSFRVISMNNVISINGSTTSESSNNNTQIVHIEGSKGNKYTVTIQNNNQAISCTCPGFQFRNQCKHLQKAVEKLQEG